MERMVQRELVLLLTVSVPPVEAGNSGPCKACLRVKETYPVMRKRGPSELGTDRVDLREHSLRASMTRTDGPRWPWTGGRGTMYADVRRWPDLVPC